MQAENQNLTLSAQSTEYRQNRSVHNSGRRAQTKLDQRGVDIALQNLSLCEQHQQRKMSISQRHLADVFSRLELTNMSKEINFDQDCSVENDFNDEEEQHAEKHQKHATIEMHPSPYRVNLDSLVT